MSLTLTRRHNVDRFGYLIPTKYGNVPMVEAVATYRPGEGRFGGAVAVEEGTTNLANNPTFSGAVGTTPSGWHSDVTIRQDDFFGQLINVAELLCVSGNDYEDFGTSIYYPLEHNTTYTISFWARGTMEPTYELSISRGIASATWKFKPPMSLQWQRYEVTIVTASSGVIYPFWWVLNNVNDVNVGKWVRIAHIQLEQKPFATSFVDGTRVGGVLTYDASILPVQSATVAAWVWVPPSSHWPTSDFRRIISNNNSSATSRAIVLYFSPGNRRLSLSIRDDANTQQVISTPSSITEGWYHIAATWDVSRMALYVDGSLVAQQTNPSLPTSHPNPWISVGARTDDRDHFNGLIDELLILPYAASEEEIRAWYEATGPLPPHPQATLQWDRQAVRPATMVAL